MSVMKSVRALALPALSLSVPEFRPWGRRAAVFLLCLASALLLTTVRLEITKLRYGLSETYRQREALAGDVARLEVQASALSSPKRIEELARKMGFVYPDRGSYRILDE